MKSKHLKDIPIIINGFITGQLVMLAGITWTTGILWLLGVISFFGMVKHNMMHEELNKQPDLLREILKTQYD